VFSFSSMRDTTVHPLTFNSYFLSYIIFKSVIAKVLVQKTKQKPNKQQQQ